MTRDASQRARDPEPVDYLPERVPEVGHDEALEPRVMDWVHCKAESVARFRKRGEEGRPFATEALEALAPFAATNNIAYSVLWVAQSLPEAEPPQRQWTKQDLDAEMRGRVAFDANLAMLSQREWANLLHCSASLVAKVVKGEFWVELHKSYGRGRSGPTKIVGLTPAVEATSGRDDAELQALIAEQTRDDVDSPLVVDRPRPRLSNRR